MRWLVGFVLLLLALGTLRTVGCGDDDPCGGCDDGNPCTRDVCDSLQYIRNNVLRSLRTIDLSGASIRLCQMEPLAVAETSALAVSAETNRCARTVRMTGAAARLIATTRTGACDYVRASGRGQVQGRAELRLQRRAELRPLLWRGLHHLRRIRLR